VFSYEDLKSGKAENIDPSRKEIYLSDEEFQKLFNTTKAEFEKQPKWKRAQAKKKVGLF